MYKILASLPLALLLVNCSDDSSESPEPEPETGIACAFEYCPFYFYASFGQELAGTYHFDVRTDKGDVSCTDEVWFQDNAVCVGDIRIKVMSRGILITEADPSEISIVIRRGDEAGPIVEKGEWNFEGRPAPGPCGRACDPFYAEFPDSSMGGAGGVGGSD